MSIQILHAAPIFLKILFRPITQKASRPSDKSLRVFHPRQERCEMVRNSPTLPHDTLREDRRRLFSPRSLLIATAAVRAQESLQWNAHDSYMKVGRDKWDSQDSFRVSHKHRHKPIFSWMEDNIIQEIINWRCSDVLGQISLCFKKLQFEKETQIQQCSIKMLR